MALATLDYHNASLGQTESVSILIPEVRHEGPFPVLYLLHGIGDNHTDWVRRTRLEEYVKDWPLLVVMPTTPWQSMYVDGNAGPAGTAIAGDLVDFIDARFRTVPEPSARALCGLSMGGYGALHLALAYPERFGAAASHSGALMFGHRNVDEAGDEATLNDRLTLRLLGPTPRGGPCDLFAQAEALAREAPPALYLDCGTEDSLLDANRAFHQHLNAIGYPHDYVEHPGGHTWLYWDTHVSTAISFCARVLGWERPEVEL